MKRSIGLFFLCAALLMISCVQIEGLWSFLRRPPLPAWIISVDDSTDSTLLHLVIDESIIWEPGDDVISLGKQIGETLQVQIDRVILPKDKIITLAGLQSPIYEYDDNENPQGSYYRLFDLVVFALGIEQDLHKATIQITSTSGIVYAYSWYFVVDENIPTTTIVN